MSSLRFDLQQSVKPQILYQCFGQKQYKLLILAFSYYPILSLTPQQLLITEIISPDGHNGRRFLRALAPWRVDSCIPHSALQGYYKYTIKEEGALQPLLLLITINSFCNMYFYLQTLQLLSGKAFNIQSYILHFDLRNVSYM